METIQAKGRSGKVSFDGERVTIEHNTAGTKVVPIERVSHTWHKRAGRTVNGLWGVAVHGQVMKQRNVAGMRAAMDGNMILMRGKRQREEFDALDAAVNAAINNA